VLHRYTDLGYRHGKSAPLKRKVKSEMVIKCRSVSSANYEASRAFVELLLITDPNFEAKKRTDVHWVQHICGEDPGVGAEH
jgi:hypothetical protein